jgi:hypothetical protein
MNHEQWKSPEPTRKQLDTFTANAVRCGSMRATDADPEAFATPAFKEFVESMGFQLDSLTPNQLQSMQKYFDAMQAGSDEGEDESLAATGAETPGFVEFVQSMGFELSDLNDRQKKSLADVFDEGLEAA